MVEIVAKIEGGLSITYLGYKWFENKPKKKKGQDSKILINCIYFILTELDVGTHKTTTAEHS